MSNQRHTPAAVPFQNGFSWQTTGNRQAVLQLSAACQQQDGCRNLDDSLLLGLIEQLEPSWGWLEPQGRACVQARLQGTLAQFEMLVHPQWRGRGWGSWILQQTLQHLRDQGASQVDTWAYGDQENTVNWLMRAGFVPHTLLLQLERPLPPAARPEWPDGWQIRGFRSDDVEAWHQLHVHVQSDPRRAWSRERLLRQLQDPETPARQFWMLWQGSQPRGYVWLKGREVFLLAVDPDCRGQRIGESLLLWALADCPGPASAFCDASREGAVKLFRRVGFVEIARDRCLRKDL